MFKTSPNKMSLSATSKPPETPRSGQHHTVELRTRSAVPNRKSTSVRPAWDIPPSPDKLADGTSGDYQGGGLDDSGDGLDKRNRKARRGARGRVSEALLPVLVWAVHLLLLGLLGQQLHSQWQEYRAQPVSSTVLRRQAPFPLLTLCPGATLRHVGMRHEAEKLLAGGNVTLEQFYDITTLQLLELKGRPLNWMRIFSTETSRNGDRKYRIPGSGRLGTWRARYYLTMSRRGDGLNPTRCLTLEPSEYLKRRARNLLYMELVLMAARPFQGSLRSSYRLFVHGADEPNVGDLVADELGPRVAQTESLDLPHSTALSMRLGARLFSQVNVRHRPCREEPGYSENQCLKECLWRRLAANVSCRMPHMVSAGVYLPDTAGPLDHLPVCDRLVQMKSIERGSILRMCGSDGYTSTSGTCTDIFQPWYRPHELLPLVPTAASSALTLGPSAQAAFTSNLAIEANTSDYHTPNSRSRAAFLFGKHCPPPRGLQTFLQDGLLTETQGCDCLPACRQALYDLSEGSRRYTVVTSNCTVRVTLAIDLTADEVQEAIAFTLPTLLANIGGTVGIVTGYSLFTLAGASEALVRKFIQK